MENPIKNINTLLFLGMLLNYLVFIIYSSFLGKFNINNRNIFIIIDKRNNDK